MFPVLGTQGILDDSWMKDAAFREVLGLNTVMDVSAKESKIEAPQDLCLGGFYLGVCTTKKMDAYRASRGDVSKKVTWQF